jgi:hypothetical protein
MAGILFQSGSVIVLPGWLALIVAAFWAKPRPQLILAARFVIPALLAAAYVYLITMGLDAFKDGGFNSITQVRALFSHDGALTAGWLHYLAFDLFVGAWIVERGTERGLNGLLLLPCLVLTFLFGPAGYLLFLLLSLTPRKA